MIRYHKLDDQNAVQLSDFQQSGWINIQPPFNNEEIEQLSDRLHIPLDFLTDSLDMDERSRYESEDDIRLIVINTPLLNEESQQNQAIYFTAPIGIILTEDHTITITGMLNPVIQKFLDGRVKNFNPDDQQLFVLQIFEQTVYSYLESLKKLNLKRNLIENELYNSSRNRELKQLLRIEKSLVYFVNSLSSNELLKMKMKRTDYLGIKGDELKTDLFEDIIIDNSQALEMSNVYTNILSGTMEAYASIVSNNMNVFIQRLTVITIILMVPTLVASFYGMNLKHMPFKDHPFAFYGLMLISILFGVLLILLLRKGKTL